MPTHEALARCTHVTRLQLLKGASKGGHTVSMKHLQSPVMVRNQRVNVMTDQHYVKPVNKILYSSSVQVYFSATLATVAQSAQ